MTIKTRLSRLFRSQFEAMSLCIGLQVGIALQWRSPCHVLLRIPIRLPTARLKRLCPTIPWDAVKAAEIDSWIEQLNEPSLTKRRKAKESLIKLDAAAIPFLAKAAFSDKRELIVYSLEVLGILMDKSPSEETRKAARITLEMLSESEQPSTADRASRCSIPSREIKLRLSLDGTIPIRDSPMAWATKRSVSASNSNGVKSIRIEADGKVTTFRDEPRGAIRVSIEEGGKKNEFVAKNLADLKKKNPDAHALYEEHSKGFGGAMGFVGGFSPGGFPANGFQHELWGRSQRRRAASWSARA